MDSWPTIRVSIAVLTHQQSTREPARGPSPQSLWSGDLNALPLRHSRLSPPLSMRHLRPLSPRWELHRSSLPEAARPAALHRVLKPVKDKEPSKAASVPVNLVNVSHAEEQAAIEPLCSDWAPVFPVIIGKVTSVTPGPRGTLNINVALIKTYKAGQLSITQAGESMSVKLVSQCRKCPLLRRGL